MSKTTRKVTVDTSRRPSVEGTASSADGSSKTRKKSVFERLGTAGSSYEPESSRTYSRDGSSSFGPNIGTEAKKSKKEKYNESDDEMYQDTDRSPESKKEKRRLQDGERLKIEFKKDNLVKKKHTISALYEEEVPIRKMKKEREKREKELHAKHKLGEGVMITKDENFRNIQIKVDEKKERKSKLEAKDDEDSQSETSSSKKHRKKRKHEESEEDVKERTEILPKRKKKKKEKSRHGSSSSESESEREKKKKNKKDKYKSYESEDSVNEGLKKKSKSYDHEDIDDKKMITETKKKKKKKKEKYESESEESSERETFYGKKEKVEKGYDVEKIKKSRKTIDEDTDIVKKKKASDGKKQRYSPGFKKESYKGKEKFRRSASYSSLSSGSSLGEEEDENIELQKKNRKKRDEDIDKEHRFDKKSKDRRRDKHQDERDNQIQDDGRDLFVDERRKDLPPDNYQRDHHSQHPEPRYEHWERDRPAHEQSSHYGSPYYGRPRGPEPYRPRYEPSVKGASDRERAGYRQYSDGGYGSDQGRYRDRGNRDSYPYQGSRRSGGYVGEDEGYPPGGRSRDSFAGAKDPQQNYAREEKQGQRYRDHQGAKIDQDEFDERGRRKSGHRASRERKEYGSKSPVSKRRSRSPKDVGKDTSKDKFISKKRKRMDDSPHSEKDHSVERKIKKPKGEMKSDSEKESNAEVDPKGEKNKKYTEAERRDGGRRPHRELDIHQKRDDYPEEKRDRKTDKSKGHEKDKERGSERDRERDRKSKGSSAGDRSKTSKVQSKTEKRSDTPSNEDSRLEKAEDRRISSLKTSNRHSSPSRRSDSESGSKSQKKRGRSGQDGQDVNLDDVYEKISDDELDFFDEESSKIHKPASLEDLDWSALSAIAPPIKKGSENGQTHRSKHSGVSVLKSIGFSSKLLGIETVKSIQRNFADSEPQHGVDGSEEVFENGTAALIASKIESRKHLKDLIPHLASEGAILSMRKDINIRKELRIPPNRLSISYNLYSNAPTAPPDRELLLASTSLYKKIIPGESKSCCKTIPSLLGSIVVCTNG